MTRGLEGLARRRPESGNTHRFTQNDTKEYQTGKDQAMMEYMDSGSRNPPPIHNRLALEMNRCIKGAHMPE